MKANKFLVAGIAAVLAVGVGMVLFATLRAPASLPTVSAAGITPTPAQEFQLKLFSGRSINLSDFKGKRPVVVNFWASWCPPCRDEAPVLAKVSKEYAGRVEFIGVVENDTQTNAQSFMNEFGITYDNGIDQSNIGAKYGITGIPETFWIDKNGQLVDHWIGAIDEASLTDRTQRLLK